MPTRTAFQTWDGDCDCDCDCENTYRQAFLAAVPFEHRYRVAEFPQASPDDRVSAAFVS